MKLMYILILVAFSIGLTNAQKKNYKASQQVELDFLTKKIQKDPENIYWYSARANVHDNLNNFSASNDDYTKVLAMYVQNPVNKFAKIAADACYFLADDYFFRSSNKIAASKFLEMGMDITPNDKRFEIIQVGIMGTYPDKYNEAQIKFEKLIEKYPNDEMLFLYYGKFLERIDPVKSANYYQDAIKLNPENTDALFALGAYHTNEASHIYTTTGDVKKALAHAESGIRYLEKVHELIPQDTEIIEMLIQSYENINRDEDVKRMEQKLHQ